VPHQSVPQHVRSVRRLRPPPHLPLPPPPPLQLALPLPLLLRLVVSAVFLRLLREQVLLRAPPLRQRPLPLPVTPQLLSSLLLPHPLYSAVPLPVRLPVRLPVWLPVWLPCSRWLIACRCCPGHRRCCCC